MLVKKYTQKIVKQINKKESNYIFCVESIHGCSRKMEEIFEGVFIHRHGCNHTVETNLRKFENIKPLQSKHAKNENILWNFNIWEWKDEEKVKKKVFTFEASKAS